MPVAYRLGDVVVLPSRGPGETWGLAVNEAMACGRPAVVSDRVGCAPDLIQPDTGRVVPVGDADALAVALAEIVRRPARPSADGRCRRAELIGAWTLDEAAAASSEASVRSFAAPDGLRRSCTGTLATTSGRDARRPLTDATELASGRSSPTLSAAQP